VRDRRDAEQDTLARALARDMSLDELEREYIQRVVAAEGGNKTRAAQRLGLDRKTLYRKLEEYAARTTSEAGRAGAGGDDPSSADANASGDVPKGGGVID
jgi:two-component system response regulator HydG